MKKLNKNYKLGKKGIIINNLLDGRTRKGKPIKKIAKVIWNISFWLMFTGWIAILSAMIIAWVA